MLNVKAPTPSPLPCPLPLAAFALGDTHLLALSTSSPPPSDPSPSTSPPAAPTVYVLGDNLLGQLGLPSTPRVNVLTPLPLPSPVLSVFAGPYSSLFTSASTVLACGSNQANKLTLSTPSPTPQSLPHLTGRGVTAVQCDANTTHLWVPSTLTRVEPEWISAGGGGEVRLWGVGLFPHRYPVSVRFTYLTVVETVEAAFDPDGFIRATAPALPPMVVCSPEVERCQVQVSLDSVHWTPAIPVYVYPPPPSSPCALYPCGGSLMGGGPVQLRIELEPMPYPPMRVRLDMGDEVQEVEGAWDAQRSRLVWTQPAWKTAEEVRVSLSLNGEQWHRVDPIFTVYNLQQWTCSREALSIVPSRVTLHVQGCPLHICPQSAVHLCRVLSSPHSRWAVGGGERGAGASAREGGDRAYGTATRKDQETELHSRLLRGEEERDEEERKWDDDWRQKQAAQAEEAAKQAEERRLQHEGEDNAWAALTETERQGRGGVECVTPSFIELGPCSVRMSLCVNEVDWHDTGLVLTVEGPRIDRLIPDCAPTTGDTAVRITGDGIFPADDIAVSITTVQPVTPSLEVEDAKSTKAHGPPS